MLVINVTNFNKKLCLGCCDNFYDLWLNFLSKVLIIASILCLKKALHLNKKVLIEQILSFVN